MKLKRGRPKEPKDVEKINPKNVHLEVPISDTTTTNSANHISQIITFFKCDIPRCPSKAEVFINVKYCKLCAQDKGFA